MATHACTISVNAPVEAVYRMWSVFENYPSLLSHVRRVERIAGARYRWQVEMMGQYEWESVNEGWIENRRIGWRSTKGSPENSGSILFEEDAAHPKTTLLTVQLVVNPPSGTAHVAAAAAAAEAAFEAQLRDDLEDFAETVEAVAMERSEIKPQGVERGTDHSETKRFDSTR